MSATTHHRESTRRDLGAGFFSLSELRAYLALSGSERDAGRASWWLGSVLNPVAHKPRRPDYSFSDLISLFVVRELRKKGVSTQAIRDAEHYLRRKWRTDRPLISDEIQTDGRRILVAEGVIAGQIESADLEGQQLMLVAVKDQLASVHYSENMAASWSPAEGVVIDPRIQFGDPVVAGTRLPTSFVAEIAEHDGQDAAARLDIEPQDVDRAVAFERRLGVAATPL